MSEQRELGGGLTLETFAQMEVTRREQRIEDAICAVGKDRVAAVVRSASMFGDRFGPAAMVSLRLTDGRLVPVFGDRGQYVFDPGAEPLDPPPPVPESAIEPDPRDTLLEQALLGAALWLQRRFLRD